MVNQTGRGSTNKMELKVGQEVLFKEFKLTGTPPTYETSPYHTPESEFLKHGWSRIIKEKYNAKIKGFDKGYVWVEFDDVEGVPSNLLHNCDGNGLDDHCRYGNLHDVEKI